jgi:integrase
LFASAAKPLEIAQLARIRQMEMKSGVRHVGYPDQYSSHSLRRGFGNWASSNGWDLKTLMEYVGWKNVHSAMRYVNGAAPFGRNGIAQVPAPELPVSVRR